MQSKIRNLNLCLWVIFWVIFSSFHPFYVSVAEIKINTESKKADISIKCFTNDLETVLRKEVSDKVNLLDNKKFETNKSTLSNYFKKNFKVKCNNKEVDYNILGFEKEEDAIWVYFETEKIKLSKTNKVEIKNTVLYTLNPEQLNIMHLLKGDLRLSAKIKQPDTTYLFNL